MNNHPTATALSVSGAADVVADTAASATQAATTPPIVVGNNGHVVPSIPPFTSIDANQLTVAVAAALASLPPAGTGAASDRSLSHDGATTTTNKKKRKKKGGKRKKDDNDEEEEAASSNKKPKKGKKGMNFTRAETMCFLDLIEAADKFPLCMTAWDEIAEKHSEFFPLTERDGEGLRRKFNSLANKKMPTGDPRIPPEVKKAKDLRWQMGESAGLKTGSPEKDDAADLTNIHVDGGAYCDEDDDDDMVDFSGGGPDYDGEEDDNDDDESNDDDDDDDDDEEEDDDDAAKFRARKKLKAAPTKSKNCISKLVTPAVSKEFTSSVFNHKQSRKNSGKKQDDDEEEADNMKSFMQMFMMQCETDREERRLQADRDREEMRLQMAQAKMTQDMIQMMFMRSMGMMSMPQHAPHMSSNDGNSMTSSSSTAGEDNSSSTN